MTRRNFHIEDVDCTVMVELTTRKDILGYVDELIENIEYGYDMVDYACTILYNDGSYDYINENDYDGHHVKRTNIASIVYDNPCTSIVFGNFELNEYGVVTPSFETKIAEENIKEVA